MEKEHKRYYRIGEVAEILGMTKEGVRYLERQGILPSVREKGNRYRLYQRRDIAVVQQADTSAILIMKEPAGHRVTPGPPV